MKCAVCGAKCRWVDDAWVCIRKSCGAEWYPEPSDVPPNDGSASP